MLKITIRHSPEITEWLSADTLEEACERFKASLPVVVQDAGKVIIIPYHAISSIDLREVPDAS